MFASCFVDLIIFVAWGSKIDLPFVIFSEAENAAGVEILLGETCLSQFSALQKMLPTFVFGWVGQVLPFVIFSFAENTFGVHVLLAQSREPGTEERT